MRGPTPLYFFVTPVTVVSRLAPAVRRSTTEKIDRIFPACARPGHLDAANNRNPVAAEFCVGPVLWPET